MEDERAAPARELDRVGDQELCLGAATENVDPEGAEDLHPQAGT